MSTSDRIDFIQNGENIDEDVLNRPSRGLADEFDRVGLVDAIKEQATLSLDFANNKHRLYEVDGGMTWQPHEEILDFSRASEATYIDATGVLRTAAVDEPRFTYENGEVKGLLIEEQRTNLLLWSEAFDYAYWEKVSMSITPDDAVAPDSALTADKVVPTSATSTDHRLDRYASFTSGNTYTLSVYVKPDGYQHIALFFALENQSFTFDLVNLTSKESVGFTGGIASNITKLANGYVRCDATFAATSTGSAEIRFYILDTYDFSQRDFIPDGTSGVYFWGAQLEEGSSPTSYIATEGSQVTREADNASVDDLAGWFNADSFTIYANLTRFPAQEDNPVTRFLSLSDGTNNNRITVREAGSVLIYVGSGVLQTFDVSAAFGGLPAKIAYSYDGANSNLRVAINAQTIIDASVSGAFTGANILRLNRGQAGANHIVKSSFKEVRSIPRALSAAELEALTAPD